MEPLIRELMSKSPKKPTLLLVLDGWGHAQATDWNAVTQAPAENFLSWWEKWPHALLSASGQEVGLPLGLMGNSEVGHTNLGAGRVVYQDVTRIDKAIADGEFDQNGTLRGAVEQALQADARLHLVGLIGNGGVHASDRHYRALIQLAKSMGLPKDRLLIQALLDGRDTAPDSALKFMQELEEFLDQTDMGRVASVCGRYYGMDRDQRWERVEKFWNCIVHGEGLSAASSQEAIQASYKQGVTDEFVLPTVIGAANEGVIRDQDSVLFFNYRSDRVRQISQAFLFDQFDGFERRSIPSVHYATMTQYRKDFPCPIAFPPRELRSLFGEIVAARGMTQMRCAETEKYAHVTFFFNGGREEVYEGEERVLVPSPKVATYDLQPEMSSAGVTDAVLERIQRGEHDLYVVNFANADMVGHTGIQEAAESAVRAVDQSLGRLVKAALEQGGTIAITADHGNAEMMMDPRSGGIHTAHTTNPVPFLLIGEAYKGAQLRELGILADVTPTLLKTMGIEQPDVMDGQSLLS